MSQVFINEFNYNSPNTTEFVEIAGPADTDLTGWSVVLYRTDGTSYQTINLNGFIDNEGGSGFGALGFGSGVDIDDNGGGIALVNASGVVQQFISYGGVAPITATDGPAANGPAATRTSTPTGVTQNSTVEDGSVEFRGTGNDHDDFTYVDVPGSNSINRINNGQTFNADPVAVDDTASTSINTEVTIDVLDNDTDAENDDLEIRTFNRTSAEGGSVRNEDGNLIYTPRTGFVGTDSFTYQITDEEGNRSERATVTVTVGGSAAGDNLTGGTGDDSIRGGAGNDTIIGGTGDDTLVGQAGDDLLFGQDGEDDLRGGAGNDSLNGGGDGDILRGGDGDDTLNGGPGEDDLRGGNGVDTADYTNFRSGLDVNLAAGTATVNGVTDTLSDIENVIGTENVDRFIGNGENNVFEGRGNTGSETFVGTDGNSYVARQDVVEYDGNQADFTITGTPGNLTVSGPGIGTDTLIGVELLKFNDTAQPITAAEALNDGPVAQDDSFTIDESDTLTGSLFANNGNGVDSEPTGDSFDITEVNGVAASVGNEIDLGSGAKLTVNADGSFSYNPNGQFDFLNQGQTDTDSFTYTIEDSVNGTDTARATITINGEGGVVTPPPVSAGPLVQINGAAVTNGITSYGGSQDETGTATVSPSNKLTMFGNNWKKVDIGSTTLNSNSTLKFEYQGSSAELHAIGFDTNNSVSSADSPNLFRVGGSEVSNPIARTGTTSDGFGQYEITVGINGTFNFLTFVNDDDAGKDGQAHYRNVEIHTNGGVVTPPPAAGDDDLNITINGSSQAIEVEQYDDNRQNTGITATVTDSNNELDLRGNGWRKVDIAGFEIESDTTLSFEFRNNNLGEVIGIGFDNNNDISRSDDGDNFFQLTGIQSWGIEQSEFGDSVTIGSTSSDGFTSYSIEVGDFITPGETFNFLTFGNDDDANAGAVSEFRNISLA
ncbi:MAG: Ig-like domain-containing protein [Rivularia sp. (in: cyanobacteria)]